MNEAVKRWRATERPGDGAVVEVVDAVDHDRIVSSLTEAGVKMQAERDKLAERCRELEGIMLRTYQAAGMGVKDIRTAMEDCPLDIEVGENIKEIEKECNALRAEVGRLTALQLPPDHLPMPRRMLELLIGDPQDPYRANAESVASEMLRGVLPDPESHEREFSAVRNVRLMLAEVDRLRAELNTRPGPGMRLCTACKAWHPATEFDPGMACCRAANERNPVYFVRLPDGRMEMHHKDGRDVQS